MPISAIPAFLDGALAALRDGMPEGRAIAYGHVGDGNIHLNVIPPSDWPKDRRLPLFEKAEHLIFSVVDRLQGSISAEHGIGRAKKRAFLERVDPVSLDLATRIRAVLDPVGLLSPGRIFGQEGSTET